MFFSTLFLFKKTKQYAKKIISGIDYEKLVHATFSDVQTFSKKEYHYLFNAEYMQNAANKNEIFSVHFRGHADNVRRLQVFTRSPHLNKLVFRQGTYNFSSYGSRHPVLNIFRFFFDK